MNNQPTMQQVYDYYTNDFITKQLVENGRQREVAGALLSGAYEKRPNIIQYPSDIAQMVRKGVTSFHLSVERWKYPMNVTRENYDTMRSGWDLVLDIDSKIGMEGAQITAVAIVDFLEKYDIRNYSIKFSGSRGFHICLPWEMFPKEIDYVPLEKRYPEIPRVLSDYLRHSISQKLMNQLLQRWKVSELIELRGEAPPKMDPFHFVEIEKNWGNRHMFRAPFSLNEKKWLVSTPLTVNELKNFSFDFASIGNVLKNAGKYGKFFAGEENEALQFLTDAMDWHAARTKQEKKPVKKVVSERHDVIGEQFFPPCIKLILAGLRDGRKRSVFTLTQFLKKMNWQQKNIEEKIMEWNQRNQPPLAQNILIGQLRWAQQNELNPANCFNDTFYVSFGVCQPDPTCRLAKNPISYPFKKMPKPERKSSQRAYSCGSCPKTFTSMRSLNLHKGRSHNMQG